ncbi:craniofacial development-like protein [Tasmannia lanceolata]|uniref:craniofacial development-like protein n=1 Tax=Tasmannia lanceolata TaxID=3420 RepID=UPI004064279F
MKESGADLLESSKRNGKRDGVSSGIEEEVELLPNPKAQLEEIERKSRIDAAWEQMNSSTSVKMPKSFTNKPSSTGKKTSQNSSPNWMVTLGLVPKKPSSGQDLPQKRPGALQNGTSDETKSLAAAALSAVRDAAVATAAAGRGKVEITEVRDFAGEEIEVKKLVDVDSKEAAEKAKAWAGPPSGLDAILEQIKKKPKLSVLDKTKKDWGEFKEENKGLEDELETYKKSSNQYLDKVSFLQRTDYREFERERDARLALQAKRRPDTHNE